MHTHPRSATRTMYIAFIWTRDNVVMFDLEMKNSPMLFHIAMSADHPVIQAFADANGQIGELLELQGTEARFHFDNFTSNGWIECAHLTRIQRLKSKA